MRVLAWAGLFTCQIATSEAVSVSITAVSTYVHKCSLANRSNSSKHVSLCPSSALPMPSIVANCCSRSCIGPWGVDLNSVQNLTYSTNSVIFIGGATFSLARSRSV